MVVFEEYVNVIFVGELFGVRLISYGDLWWLWFFYSGLNLCVLIFVWLFLFVGDFCLFIEMYIDVLFIVEDYFFGKDLVFLVVLVYMLFEGFVV